MSFKVLSYKDLQDFSSFDNHENVRYIYDDKSELEGFIAIHNTKLGSAVGGTRMYPYKTKNEALNDVLRLSRAMTYKCAAANVSFGGGKAVIVGDPRKDKNKDLLKSYALEIDDLKGKFYTGEDVGISEEDVQYLLSFSPYFIGKSALAGDPSPFASLSTYYSMKVACKFVFGSESLSDRRIAIKGVGKVGGGLVDLLMKENPILFIADINNERCEEFKKRYPAIEIVGPDEIHKLNVEVYAPCALGAEFNDETKKEIKAKIICGASNNQLLNEEVGDWFFNHKIFYIPDYISNSGGLIDVVDELETGGFKKDRVLKRIENVKKLVLNILETSKKENTSTNKVANRIAESKFR